MRLIGLLSWFDEPVTSLVRCLTGLAESGVDHLVALDGRYGLYPADHDQSAPEEYAAILLGCRQLGMGCTITQPRGPWMGGEVEKRTALFATGWQHADPGDWFWVQDADQWTVQAPDDLKARLAVSDRDVAIVDMVDVVALRANVKHWPAHFEMRSLFRAQPIRVESNHVNYVTEDGRRLWGRDRSSDIEAPLDLTGVVRVEHHPLEREHDRQHAKLMYYAERDASGVERGLCELCGERAVSLEPVRWRWTDIGPVADWMECCATHTDTVRAVNDLELRKLGIDPGSVVHENRNGRAPDTLAKEGV